MRDSEEQVPLLSLVWAGVDKAPIDRMYSFLEKNFQYLVFKC